MTSIQKHIEKLNDVVSNRINEASIVLDGEAMIELLRDIWRTDRKQFAESDICTLKKTSRQLDALKEFLLEQEDFPDLVTLEDADEVIGRLYSIVEHLDGLAVSGRVRKEIRELMERRATMPIESERKKSAELSVAISRLTQKAPSCKKCGSRMVLRQGPSAYFWGCSIFPGCWGKQWLKQSEQDSIPD